MSCNGNDEPEEEYVEAPANALGVTVRYFQGLEVSSINLWINSDIVKDVSTDFSIVYIENCSNEIPNSMNSRYYPMDMEIAEELILKNSSLKGEIEDHIETQEIYNYIERNKSQYNYIVDLRNYGIGLFNRSSNNNY